MKKKNTLDFYACQHSFGWKFSILSPSVWYVANGNDRLRASNNVRCSTFLRSATFNYMTIWLLFFVCGREILRKRWSWSWNNRNAHQFNRFISQTAHQYQQQSPFSSVISHFSGLLNEMPFLRNLRGEKCGRREWVVQQPHHPPTYIDTPVRNANLPVAEPMRPHYTGCLILFNGKSFSAIFV